MKKGRHRRFEEARKLKQSGPEAFDGIRARRGRQPHSHRRRRRVRRARREVRRHVRRRRRGRGRPLGPARSAAGVRLDSHREPTPLRNVALVAHVDHGKTTLVDAMLRATGVFARPPGTWSTGSWTPTTRSASGASRSWPRRRRSSGGDVRDQPRRHPGPRRLRRRGRAGAGHGRRRAAARRRRRGPAAADPLRAVEGAGRPTCRRSSCSTRSTATTPGPTRCSTRSTSCSSTSTPTLDHLDFPVVSAVAREGRRWPASAMPADDADLDGAARRHRSSTIPAPAGDPDAPLQALVTNLDAVRLPRPARHRPGRERRRCAEARPWRCSTRRRPRASRRCGGGSTQLLGFDGHRPRVEVDELARRRPVRRRRLPRGRDRRHASPTRPTRAAAAARPSTSPCCA